MCPYCLPADRERTGPVSVLHGQLPSLPRQLCRSESILRTLPISKCPVQSQQAPSINLSWFRKDLLSKYCSCFQVGMICFLTWPSSPVSWCPTFSLSPGPSLFSWPLFPTYLPLWPSNPPQPGWTVAPEPGLGMNVQPPGQGPARVTTLCSCPKWAQESCPSLPSCLTATLQMLWPVYVLFIQEHYMFKKI